MSRAKKTRTEILEAGLKLWKLDPTLITNRAIAEIIGKTHVTVFNHFPNGTLRKAVAAYGVQQKDSVVIVSLLLNKDPLVTDLSEEERQKHLDFVKAL